MRVASLFLQPSEGLIFGCKRLVELQATGLLKQLAEKWAGLKSGLYKILAKKQRRGVPNFYRQIELRGASFDSKPRPVVKRAEKFSEDQGFRVLAFKQVWLNGRPGEQVCMDHPHGGVDTSQRIVCDGIGKFPTIPQCS